MCQAVKAAQPRTASNRRWLITCRRWPPIRVTERRPHEQPASRKARATGSTVKGSRSAAPQARARALDLEPRTWGFVTNGGTGRPFTGAQRATRDLGYGTSGSFHFASRGRQRVGRCNGSGAFPNTHQATLAVVLPVGRALWIETVLIRTARPSRSILVSSCFADFVEAGDGARTHDPQLGKLMLYQLSYARVAEMVSDATSSASRTRRARVSTANGFSIKAGPAIAAAPRSASSA